MTNDAVRLIRSGDGPAVVDIDLAAQLDVAKAEQVARAVRAEVDALAGRPFMLLLDTRKVTQASGDALQLLQGLEMDLAGLGLERIAHVVRFAGMVDTLKKEYRELGYPDLIGTFTDREQAMAFLAGTEPQS